MSIEGKCSISTVQSMGASAADAPVAVGAHDAFADNLALIDGNLFVAEAVRDPLVMFVAVLTPE